MTPAKAADLLNVTTADIKRYINNYGLPCRWHNDKPVIDKEELMEWAAWFGILPAKYADKSVIIKDANGNYHRWIQ